MTATGLPSPRTLTITRRRRRARLLFVLAGVGFLGLAVGLALLAFRDAVVFFHGPEEVAMGQIPMGRTFRLGGLTELGSVVHDADGLIVRFGITDLKATIPVHYRGVLPNLFREGQGVVALGALDANGVFEAAEVLAKHDETYMPAEAVTAMKRAGTWRGD